MYLAGTPAVNLAGNSYNLNPSNFQPGELLNFAATRRISPRIFSVLRKLRCSR